MGCSSKGTEDEEGAQACRSATDRAACEDPGAARRSGGNRYDSRPQETRRHQGLQPCSSCTRDRSNREVLWEIDKLSSRRRRQSCDAVAGAAGFRISSYESSLADALSRRRNARGPAVAAGPDVGALFIFSYPCLSLCNPQNRNSISHPARPVPRRAPPDIRRIHLACLNFSRLCRRITLPHDSDNRRPTDTLR